MAEESAPERASRKDGVEKGPPQPPRTGIRVSETGEPLSPEEVQRDEAAEQRAREAMKKPRGAAGELE
jgi:hypothetical protein